MTKAELCEYLSSITFEEEAKAIVAFAFRNNEKFEQLHSNGKISQDDVKDLMKYAVDHVNFMLWAMKYKPSFHLGFVKLNNEFYTRNWDKPKNPEIIFKKIMKEMKYIYKSMKINKEI